MGKIKSSEKRAAQALKRRARNRSHRSRLRSAMKRLRAAIESGDAQTARELLPSTLRLIDTTAQKTVIHANAAARYKSRLVRAVQGLAG